MRRRRLEGGMQRRDVSSQVTGQTEPTVPPSKQVQVATDTVVCRDALLS